MSASTAKNDASIPFENPVFTIVIEAGEFWHQKLKKPHCKFKNVAIERRDNSDIPAAFFVFYKRLSDDVSSLAVSDFGEEDLRKVLAAPKNLLHLKLRSYVQASASPEYLQPSTLQSLHLDRAMSFHSHVRGFNNIARLTICDANFDGLEGLLRKCANLKSLAILARAELSVGGFYYFRLEELTVASRSFCHLANIFEAQQSSLRKMALNVDSLSGSDLSWIFGILSLRELEMNVSGIAIDEEFENQTIEKLTLRGCANRKELVQTVVKNCRNLKEFSVFDAEMTLEDFYNGAKGSSLC